MKKTLLTFFTAFTLAATCANAQPVWLNTTGSAVLNTGGVDGQQTYTVNMTPCPTSATPLAGAAWSNVNVDFTHCFTITFQAYFDVVFGTGGDGITVAFGSHLGGATLPNGYGGYLGYYDPGTANPPYDNNSMAVEIDNFNDCPYPDLNDCGTAATYGDHSQLSVLGTALSTTTVPYSPVPGTGPVTTSYVGLPSIKDAAWHNYSVSWIPNGMPGGPMLTFKMEGHTVWHSNYDWVAHSFFTAANSVPWGFTAGADDACSHQLITNVNISTLCGGLASGCDEKCYWTLEGNSIIPGQYIGTNNAQGFSVRTNGTQWAYIDPIGESGVHVSVPATTLDVDAAPAYAPSPSGIRFRNLPAGQGLPLVVDANGFLYVGGGTGTGGNPTNSEKNPNSSSISDLQNQINDLKQQINNLQAQLPGGTLSANSLSVTPNPTSGQVSVTYTIGGSYVNALINVTDNNGSVVLSNPVTGNNNTVSLLIPNNIVSSQLILNLVVDGKTTASQKLVLLHK